MPCAKRTLLDVDPDVPVSSLATRWKRSKATVVGPQTARLSWTIQPRLRTGRTETKMLPSEVDDESSKLLNERLLSDFHL